MIPLPPPGAGREGRTRTVREIGAWRGYRRPVARGAIDARALTVKDAEVAADGAGDIAVAASGTAKVVSGGAGNIVVTGNAACTVKATGSGEVVCGR